MPQVIESLPHIFRFVVDPQPPCGFFHNWKIIDPKDQKIFSVVTNLPNQQGYDHSVKPRPITHLCSKHGVIARIDWYHPSGTHVQIGQPKDMEGIHRLPPENEKALVVPAATRWQPVSNWLRPIKDTETERLSKCEWEMEMRLLCRHEPPRTKLQWEEIYFQCGTVGDNIAIWNFNKHGSPSNSRKYEGVAKLVGKIADLKSDFELWVSDPRLLWKEDVFKALLVVVVIIKSRGSCNPPVLFFGDSWAKQLQDIIKEKEA